jgi:hypothetical protein
VRTATAIFAMAGLALLAAGCSDSKKSHTPDLGSTATVQANGAIAFSRCMRSHGLPKFPDPGSDGQLPKVGLRQLGVSTSQFAAAESACRHLLPAGGSLQQQEAQCMQNSDCPPALVQRMMDADRKLAQCMRTHGVPNFPDPTNGGPGGPWFDISSVGISDAESHTRQFIARLNVCGRLAGKEAPESFG